MKKKFNWYWRIKTCFENCHNWLISYNKAFPKIFHLNKTLVKVYNEIDKVNYF